MTTSSQISRMSTTYDRDPMVWEVKIISIREFLEMVSDIDTLPIHQRVEVQNNKDEDEKTRIASKRQGIISSIFKGTDIGEIKINERTSAERLKFGQRYESIDGGHRKRTILGFKTNQFGTNPYENKNIGFKKFAELDEEQREQFMDYKIRLIVYKQLTPSQKAMLWATSNNFTPLNHQEQVNGVGDTPIANLIRNFARNGHSSSKTLCHKLFKTSYRKSGDVLGDYVTFTPNRLTYDRLVARIASIVYNGSKPCNCDDVDIEKMYYDNTITEDQAASIKRKTEDVLDFLYEMAYFKSYDVNAKMTENECIMLIRLWFSYQNDYESFKINKIKDYYDHFRKAWIRFNKDTDDDYALELIDAYDNKKEKRMRFTMFKDNHGKGSVNRWEDNIKWIEDMYLTRENLILNGIITIKEKRKTLTKELREQILHGQKNKCYIDGKTLKFKDAHAAHIVPLAEGGSNDRSNIRMVRAEHNTRMGTMHLEDYKDMWNKQEQAA